ncbi:AraC family transcriptional regulator [Novosphingobium sp.]|uniref:AraC family transcriptional regulator n=1 Tax=Novosphingobium sp. TaxID=1874826 RepID=UPI00273627A5|nr:AraC family transcriptional regulator [Novosphingobium sp.]MDP3908688.1 AraC family transcriptional regulator ligand-binding domain-containing protein [Novosphingobium sp.]
MMEEASGLEHNAFFSLSGPLDALPAEGQMRAANFNGFHDLVYRLGGDSRGILARFGIDPLAINDPDYFVDCRTLGSVFEYCSTRLDKSLFGLELAALQSPDVFGLVTAICRAAPTFGEAIRCFIKYVPVVHSPVSNLELVEGVETSELRFSGNSTVQDFDGCQIMFEAGLLIAKLLREVGGLTFQPSYVSFCDVVMHRDVAEIERHFGCSLRKTPGVNAIAFPTRMLNYPVANSNRQLFLLLEGYLDSVHLATRRSIVERLEDSIRSSFRSGNCSVDWCARKLGLSPRVLRIQLSQLGLKFSDVVEEQRVGMATEHLDRSDLSLDEVAFVLGYSEQSSFGRAFKRWTGITPQTYREQAR